MTKREFLDTVFALTPNEANAIMDAFDEYVDSNEPHWIWRERGDNMSEINEFMSEHWVILYGILMFVLGEIAGYIKAKR